MQKAKKVGGIKLDAVRSLLYLGIWIFHGGSSSSFIRSFIWLYSLRNLKPVSVILNVWVNPSWRRKSLSTKAVKFSFNWRELRKALSAILLPVVPPLPFAASRIWLIISILLLYFIPLFAQSADSTTRNKAVMKYMKKSWKTHTRNNKCCGVMFFYFILVFDDNNLVLKNRITILISYLPAQNNFLRRYLVSHKPDEERTTWLF